MHKKTKISLTFLCLIFCADSFGEKLETVYETSIKTAHINLQISELKMPQSPRGGGGAIAERDGDLIIATAEGRFHRLDTRNMRYKKDFLPPLYLGDDKITSSKNITYQETLPRVHDIIFFNDMYYVSYDFYNFLDDRIYFVISRKSELDKKWKIFYKSTALDVPYYALGCGGKLAIKENKLFFTVGDYSLDRINKLPSDVAPQVPTLPWGKVNYIDLLNGRFHSYTLGHRNSLGLIVLKKSGEILQTENGPQGGDEINLLSEGANYGWPLESYGTVYGSFNKYRDSLPRPSAEMKYIEPIFSFVPSVAPTSIIEIENFNTRWHGNLLMGSLKAQSLFRIKYDRGHVIYVEPIKIGYRIRDIKEHRGKIFALTDQASILKISALPDKIN